MPRTASPEQPRDSRRIPLLFARHNFLYRCTALALAALAALSLPACSFFSHPKAPPPMEFSINSPYFTTHTYAIAPAINYSGSRDFDPLVVSDTLYGELQQVQNLNVLPLNKTLLAMQRLGIHAIDDVATAQKLAQYLNADGLVIPAVTAYYPYNPPNVGMVLQLYTPPKSVTPSVTVATKPDTVRSNPDRVIFAAEVPPTAPPAPQQPAAQPVAQVTAVFNATNQSVLKELQVFADGRTQYDSPLTDQRFLVDSDLYMRFVCHAMVRRLMDVERDRVSDR